MLQSAPDAERESGNMLPQMKAPDGCGIFA